MTYPCWVDESYIDSYELYIVFQENDKHKTVVIRPVWLDILELNLEPPVDE